MSDLQKSICYLICVFNDQQGLDETLASVFEDEPLADILIVDDGSFPSVRLPQAPDGFSLHLLDLEQNMGLIAALNKGLEHVIEKNYDYMARLDAGDTVNKGRLRAQYEYMESNPSIGLLGTQVQAFDENTKKPLFKFNNPTKPKDVRRVLKLKNCVAHPSVMVRTQAYAVAGNYDPSFKYAEDYEMWRRIDNSFGVANLPEIYVNKEISPQQMTAMNRKGSILSRLRAQIKYFRPLNIWCYIGVLRSIIGLLIPRSLWKFMRSGAKRT